MNTVTRYLILFGVVVTVSYLAKRYGWSPADREEEEERELIRKYLLHNPTPKIWICVTREPNARKWESFHGRMTTQSNNAYVNRCIQSVRERNPEFEVVLIDDATFSTLLPGWEEPTTMEEKRVRTEVGKLRLLHEYGGIVVPETFYCHTSLTDFYQPSALVVADLNDTTTFMGGCKRSSLPARAILDTMIAEKNAQTQNVMRLNSEEEVYRPSSSSRSPNPNGTKGLVVVPREQVGADTDLDSKMDTPYTSQTMPKYGYYVQADALLRRHKTEYKVYTGELFIDPSA